MVGMVVCHAYFILLGRATVYINKIHGGLSLVNCFEDIHTLPSPNPRNVAYMNAPTTDHAKQWFLGLIDQGLNLQWLSLKAQWEPALTKALGQAADDCLAILRQELAALAVDPDTPPDWPALMARLGRAWAKVVGTRSEAVKALLLAMVKEVVEDTGRILTINGLAGAAPALHQPGQDPRQAYEALAGGAALDQAVAKSYVEFAGGVRVELRQAPEADLAEPYRRCQAAGLRWRGRLEMIARTVAHEVFNRVRIAVSQRLR